MSQLRECDVLVVGSGPAGLTAAAAAAERGKRVVLLDQGINPGGQVWRHREEKYLSGDGRRSIARLRATSVTVVQQARVVDAPATNELLVEVAGRVERYRAGAIILCLGAREHFLPFPGWTIPGVTGVGGLQALLKSGLVLGGARVILAGSGPLLLPVAAGVAKSGAQLMLVAEQAPFGALVKFGASALLDRDRLRHAVRYRAAFARTPFRTGTWVTRAMGDQRLSEVELTNGKKSWTERCDWLGSSIGLVPNTELAQLLGCQPSAGAIRVDDQQLTSVPGIWAAGECTGVKGEEAAMTEGEIAARAAVGDRLGAMDAKLQRRRNAGRAFGALLGSAFAPRAELLALVDDETIVCRCEDVRRGALNPAWSQRQAKLWTRIGMGACQGAVCGPACTTLFGWELNTVRPPLGTPTLGAWCEPGNDEW